MQFALDLPDQHAHNPLIMICARYHIWLGALIFGLLAFLLPASTAAQDSVNPREEMLEQLELKTIAPTADTPDPETEKPIKALSETAKPSSLEDEEPQLTAEEAVKVSEPEKPSSHAGNTKTAGLAPFYLSAHEYLAMRNSQKHPRTSYIYEIQVQNLAGVSSHKPRTVKLLLGKDYAGYSEKKSTRIYDFKLNRILHVRPAYNAEGQPTGEKLFDNTSLYARAFRNFSKVEQATEKGQKRSIKLTDELNLDSFWMESSASWMAAPLQDGLELDKTEDSLIAKFNGEAIASIKISDAEYESQKTKNTLFALAHLKWPLHPDILRALYEYPAPPEQIDMVSYGPTTPNGRRQIWTLKKRVSQTAPFPLPKQAKSVVERQPVAPLAFVIDQAVNNKALGGLPDPDILAEQFGSALEANELSKAWELGLRYQSYYGCRSALGENVCTDLKKLEGKLTSDMLGILSAKHENLAGYIKGIKLAKDGKNRAGALKALKPYLSDPETPAYVLRIAAMSRARMKPAEAKAAGLTKLKADAMMSRAIAKDPYDPYSYLGLAQIYAANQAYEQSWDLYDALREGLPTSSVLDLKIDRIEAGIRQKAPGYFLTQD